MKILLRAIRPSLDGDINQKVGLILLAHNLARTLSPLIGGYFADKYQQFKLIATIGYIAGKIIVFDGFMDHVVWTIPYGTYRIVV